MPVTASRLNVFTESVIRGMTRLANEYGAINLAQGFPDGNPPEVLVRALEKAARGPFHQYAMTWGAPRFREALARKINHFSGVPVDPDGNLVVTCGSTEAMMVAMMTACNPGDKVIIFSPFYENYVADTILSGAEPIYVPLHPPDFRYDPEQLARAFDQKPKAIVVCNPSNPSGKVFTREELFEIGDLAEKHDAFIITDEVYEHIIFAPHRHTMMASLPGFFDRTITCSSLSKTYSITGWRLGYVMASKQVIDQAKKVHDFLTVGAAAPLQEAAVVGLELPDSYYTGLTEAYTQKKNVFVEAVEQTGLEYTKPEGAYFVLVDISPLGFASDTEAAEWMVKTIGLTGVPGSSFFREPVNHLIRFHFAKDEAVLREAGARLLTVKALR
ncbi:MAG: aminotransferase class I/II-fold pyridoxal phosphate-dependent enzyme [Verrucomicrobiota bacterium]|nr:aminotransferase class I/II-fold pyridoxal phosphate-dependent enzyme [Verrucomicrobiota bacterium]